MIRYSVEPKDEIFVKGYGLLPFAENMSKKIRKDLSKNLSGKYYLKHLDHAKQPAIEALKNASKRAIQKLAELTEDLAGNKIANKIAKIKQKILSLTEK